LYAGCFSANCDFDFNNVIEGLGPAVPNTVSAGTDFTQILGRIPGLDNGFESMIIKISAGSVSVCYGCAGGYDSRF